MSELKETPESKETRPPFDTKSDLSETAKNSIRGSEEVPLSTQVQSDLIDAKTMPVENRRQAVADINKTKEGQKAAKLGGGIMRDGKGVTIDDADGIQHEINYEKKNDTK